MKEPTKFVLSLLLCVISPGLAQEKSQVDLQKGVNLIETKVYSDQENRRILKLYEGLRVATSRTVWIWQVCPASA